MREQSGGRVKAGWGLAAALKRPVKAAIRGVVYARLSWIPLNERQAIYWAEKMKRIPAIFGARPYRREVAIECGTMRVGLIDVIERSLHVGGEWDRHVLEALRVHLRPGDTFVDVGANIGYFTLFASRLVGTSGRVVAIEPAQGNLARLCDHLAMNQSANVLVVSTAAGSSHGVPFLHLPTPNNNGAANLRPAVGGAGHAVFQAPLDELFESCDVRPQLIKLDIEGFELEALRGLKRTLERHAPVVVCELTNEFLHEIGQDARELLQFMESLGYRCRSLELVPGTAGRELRSETILEETGQLDVIFSPASPTRSVRQ